MQNKIALIAGGLLGLIFVVFGLNFFLKFIPIPSPPADSAAAAFMGAMYTTGFLTLVKILEVIGAFSWRFRKRGTSVFSFSGPSW